MTAEKLHNLLPDDYHDGALCDALYKEGTLYLYCFRNPFDPDGTDNKETRYIIIRFDNVTDLQIYDWWKKAYLPYHGDSLTLNDIDAVVWGTDYLCFDEGFVEFGQCLRFRCEDLEVIAHSSEELDFSKYVKID